jgi:peroxiredoxin
MSITSSKISDMPSQASSPSPALIQELQREAAQKLLDASSISSKTPAIPSPKSPPCTGFWPGCQAPAFHAVPCLRAGAPGTLDLSSLRGKDVLLLFQPVDFGYIGPSELELLDGLGPDTEVVAVSSGSLVGKQAFLGTPRCAGRCLPILPCHRSEGGGEGLALTLLEDRGGRIAQAFGVLREGSGYR